MPGRRVVDLLALRSIIYLHKQLVRCLEFRYESQICTKRTKLETDDENKKKQRSKYQRTDGVINGFRKYHFT